MNLLITAQDAFAAHVPVQEEGEIERSDYLKRVRILSFTIMEMKYESFIFQKQVLADGGVGC